MREDVMNQEDTHTVSWSKAFSTALKIVGISLVWYVVGIAIIAFGAAGAVSSAISNPSLLLNPLSFLSSIGVAIAALVIGVTITSVGTLATLLKYSAELTADEVKAKPAGEPTTRLASTTKTCPRCGTPAVSREAAYCGHCGSKF